MATSLLARKCKFSSMQKLVFSTSSEVAIKAFGLDVSDGVKALYKKSYINS